MTERKVKLIKKKKKRRNLKQHIAIILSLVLSFNIAVPAIEGIVSYAALKENSIQEINTFRDFFIFAQASQNYDYDGVTVKLNKNIDLTEQEIKAMLNEYGVTHLTIGTKDRPFKGTFDGQNHTIEGLVYDPGIIKDPNSGLFSFTDGATIKNLTLKDSSIECVYQGGNIVGHAKNTHLENLTVLNSKLKISPANNVVSLITNLGFCGGGIAGIMENSTMYNCEISGTEVVNNNTSGVTGVGGEGLYMGGLVGWMEDSVIEYSRVRSNYVNEGGSEVIKQSVVRNDYDIAVGALGGKSLYAGGIVGGVNTTDSGETRIIDCFSTADVSFYAANYVSVGSGIAGYAGGITGALRGNSHIERCHYAGNIHSKQYNAVLVIPIIQTDANISGISYINNDTSTVENSYFKRSSSTTTKDLNAVGTKEDTEKYAAKTDDVYSDYKFWESKDYDLTGTIIRDTKNSPKHVNKWVMDYDLGIPVHGDTVHATFNFPDAAKVTIDKTALVNSPASTENLYQFATQGIHPRGDHQITVHVEPKDSDPNDKITEYRFDGWHRKDMEKNYAEDIKELDCTGSTAVSNDKDYVVNEEGKSLDNILLIADMKARVAFHELDGKEIIDESYYKYDEALKEVTPKDIPENSMFYGWTTEKNPKTQGGYPAITSNELEELKQKKAIYNAGDSVEKAMNLYPIFKNDLANITTEFEGHELDDNNLASLREDVGQTLIGYDNKGAYIDVEGLHNGAFPEGYRFLGWFKQDKDDKTEEICVSKNQRYYVPDASEPVTYVARFEYRLGYYVSLKQNDDIGYNYRNFYTEWVKYKEKFDSAYAESIVPKDYDHIFNHWSKEAIKDGGSCSDTKDAIADKTEIIEPMNLYAHWSGRGTDNISIISDFPNAAALSIDDSDAGNMKFIADSFPGYEFKFWAEERRKIAIDALKSQWKSDMGVNNWSSGHPHHATYEYLAEAHLAANITFNKIDEKDNETVLRTYESNLFQKAATTIKYKYPMTKEEVGAGYTLTEEESPSDSDMKHPDKDHEFLGWIQGESKGSKNGIPLDGYVWKKIYNIADDKYCTSDAESALPYLIESDRTVTETMDLYPVYTRYNIETTTNIHEVENLPTGVEYPTVPTYTLANKDKGISTITVNAKAGTDTVIAGDDTKYKLVGMKCITSDGSETNLWKEGSQNQDGSYTFTMDVKAGENYKFIAIYSPVVVVYHLSDKDLSYEIKNINSQVGTMPVTTNPDNSNMYMIGWVKDKPTTGWYHTCSNVEEFDTKNYQIVTENNIIKQSMELYPVFVNTTIKIESNIDDELKDADSIRYLKNQDNNFSLVAKEVNGYKFKGWYKGYQSDSSLGTQLTGNNDYPLTKEEVLGTDTYTAVYEHAIDINYHDYEGNILYTAKTTIEENRSFVKDNPDDSTKEIPIDIDAFVLINEKIHQLEDSKGTNIQFVEWRLEKQDSDGKYVYEGWNDFKNKIITEEVNLYPVAYEVGFYTPKELSDGEDKIFSGIEYSVQQENDGSKRLDALFTAEYAASKLKITTKEYTWEKTKDKPDGTKIVKGLQGIHTDVYMAGAPDKDGNPTYINASDGNVDTDTDGIAIHNILGSLIIKKDYVDTAASGETIILNIKNIDNDGSERDVISIPITLDNEGKGEVNMRMPIGKYVIEEDLNWLWRDTLSNIEINGIHKKTFNAEINIGVLSPQKVVFHNERGNEKWFSDSCIKHNEFGTPTIMGGESR